MLGINTIKVLILILFSLVALMHNISSFGRVKELFCRNKVLGFWIKPEQIVPKLPRKAL